MMKNTKLKSSAILLSLVIGSTPVLACTSAPRANTSRGDSIVLQTASSSMVKTEPAADAETAEKKEESAEKTEKTEKPDKTEKTEKTDKVEKTEKVDKAAKDDKKEKPAKAEEGAEAAFTIDNFQIIQKALEKLGVKPEELEKQVKEGKKLIQVLEEAEIPVKKFKKQLYKEYCAAVKEGVKADKLTKDEAKVLKKAIKEKVDAWMSEEK